MPPMRAPQATAIISPRPKFDSLGRQPSCTRIARASGMSIAATAMSVIHIDTRVPAARNPSRIRRVSLPVTDRTSAEMRRPRPDRVMKAPMTSTPMKKTTMSLPKPTATISL